MRWVCIVFPQLALDGAQRVHPEPDQPLALLAGTSQRRVLQTVNAAARALGATRETLRYRVKKYNLNSVE